MTTLALARHPSSGGELLLPGTTTPALARHTEEQ